MIRATFDDLRRNPLMMVAGSVWAGVVLGSIAGHSAGVLVLAAVAVLGAFRPRAIRLVALLCTCLAGVYAGASGADRIAAATAAEIVPGDVVAWATADVDQFVLDDRSGLVVTISDSPSIDQGVRALVRLADDAVPDGTKVAAGDAVEVAGELRRTHGRHGRYEYQASIINASITHHRAVGGLFRIGTALRVHILDNIGDSSEADALMRGLLVGDTSHLGVARLGQLRAAGLSHFVAVSGSNVAIVVLGWWLLSAVFGLPIKVRLVTAIGVVAVFAVVTRWEPSVIRAAATACGVLAARLIGYPLRGWQALGLAVSALLLVSPELAFDVGFQLSVSATIGVMVAAKHLAGERTGLIRRWLVITATTTLFAQLAVLPIVLWRFGTVPLLSPVANVLAAPLVAVATILGGMGALSGAAFLVDVSAIPAGAVLTVAEIAAGWPQIGAGTALAVAAAALLACHPRVRLFVVAAVIGALLTALVPAPGVDGPEVIFLDVGQGDAIVLRDATGAAILIDGGGDPGLLADALDRQAISSIDMLVMSHGDADHVGGLTSLAASFVIPIVAYPRSQPISALMADVIDSFAAQGSRTISVGADDRFRIGGFFVEVLGPVRRYAGENDGSVVLLVTAASTTVLLTGDVEAVAQSELPRIRPDVLQIPHHGSATTAAEWLVDTVGAIAVISVGPNQHGHPAPEIMAALERTGVTVFTTWDSGDIVIPFG